MPWMRHSPESDLCCVTAGNSQVARDYPTVALHLNPGFALCIYQRFPGFNYTVIALNSQIRVLKPRTKLRLKFVRVLSTARQAGSARNLHTCPSRQDTFCPVFERS
jgi:hypothetical protein